MFKYNELSDLLNGTLVKPLSKMEDGSIRCIDSNDNECFYEFDDFDFDKLPEERTPSLEEQIENNPIKEDVIVDENPEEDTIVDDSTTTVDEIIKTMEKEDDDSIFDGTDNIEEPVYDEETGKEIIIEDERFLTSSEAKDILNAFGIKGRARVWRDII